jgi:hypothetical protein
MVACLEGCPMDSSIEAVQELLDETARECLRCMSSNKLASVENQRLAKFIFGCMNQKHELPSRVERRGARELLKVMRFIAAAVDLLAEIDAKKENRSKRDDN